mmetsp:Transcript_50462/g.90584  ORF Transcript_50462/g.90584 Transcript_50462/m.90584 type:complete len:257 (-) Transcript_50462:50-820(-)
MSVKGGLKSAVGSWKLEPKDLEVVIAAFKGPLVLEPGYRVIQEGDDGQHLYVVTAGTLHCIKVINGEEMVVKTCVQGDLFGELALLYNCPRAASVQSGEESVLWELDRATFNNIVMEGVQRKRTQCLAVLEKVPLFQSLSRSELENIIDALKMERHAYGTVIIQQGEFGEHFYIVYDGAVIAIKHDPEQVEEPQTFLHEAGDYFGELALLHNAPRGATVQAYSEPEVTLLSMDRGTFGRLMGSLQPFLEEHANRYG